MKEGKSMRGKTNAREKIREREKNLNDLVSMAKEGDNKALQKIIERFMPFIGKITKSVYIKGMDEDDLRQMGCISIMHAVEKFDLEKSKNFTSYVTTAIRNNYYYEIRKKGNERFNISLETPIEDGLTLEDVLQGEIDLEDDYLEKEQREALQGAIKYLTLEEKELLLVIYKNTKGALKEYAKIKGLSQSGVYKRKNNLFKKMRKLLEV